MRLRALPVFRLMLTDPSLSQLCLGGRLSLNMYLYTYDFVRNRSYYEVLLTLKNLADVRQSPAPHSLLIIPRPLPSKIVDGEHFVTTNLLSLIASSASPFGDPEVEASNREQASRAPYVPSASTSGDSSLTPPRPSRGERGIRLARLPLPRKGTGSAPRVLKIKKKGTNWGKNTVGAQVKDFVPWVRPGPSRPYASEEEEEEEEMAGLRDSYAAKKRKQQEDAEREADRIEGSSRLPTDGGLEMQAIVIPGSSEMGSSDQLGPEDVDLEEPRKDTPIPLALLVIYPHDRSESHLDIAKLERAGRKRLLPPYRILLNSYLSPCGLALVMEEVTVPRPKDIKRIIHRWKPFNRGESPADHLDDLYPRTLQIPIIARAVGLGEEYSIAVPVGTVKEDIRQIRIGCRFATGTTSNQLRW